MQTKQMYAIILSIFILFSFLNHCKKAFAFIKREYTLKEVLNASTNIVSGRVKSADKKRMRAIIEVQENLKGKSEFKHIKMNIAVGQTQGKLTSPQMLMEKLAEGLPIIVFYQKKGRNIAALGYVSRTWFQLFATDLPNRDKVWWRHTHIEAYMHRTFSGSTESLQKIVKDTLTGKMWAGASRSAVKALVLTGNGAKPVLGQAASGTVITTAEFLALKKFNKVGWYNIAYQETKDRKLPGLEKAQILWIGQREIGNDGYHLSKDTEDRIKRFVEKGGVVILSSQDSDAGRPCGSGWSPEPIWGVDGQRRSDFQVVNPLAGDLFQKRLVGLKQKSSRFRTSVVPFSPQRLGVKRRGEAVFPVAKRRGEAVLHRDTEEKIQKNSIGRFAARLQSPINTGFRSNTFQVLFQRPNVVKSGQIVMDDTWTKWSKKYTVLASTNSGKDIALAMLRYGRGMYLITALQNATEQDVKRNAPLMENLIYFAVNQLKPQTSEVSVKVLALTGNKSNVEFPALEKFDRVDGRKIMYMQTKDKRLSKLDGADILWIGQGEISEEKYLLDKSTEKKIKDFVKKGGVAIVVGQDSDQERPCEIGWITKRILGVERKPRNDFQPTEKADNLFRSPNTVKSGQVHIDDTWTGWDKEFNVLATTNSGQDIVVATLNWGRGMYIVTGIQNETQEDVKANSPLIENLIHFAVKWLKSQ